MSVDYSKTMRVPEMSAADRQGYSAVASRRELARFPQLATQVRCSTGYTHAPSGVLRAVQPERTPGRRADAR